MESLLARPDLFAGNQFFYIEPTKERGIISIGKSSTFFANIDISGELGRATLGYAKPGFGAAVRFSLGQFYSDKETETISGTEAGDDLGVTLSNVIAGYALALNVDWLTYAKETNVDPSVGKTTNENYRTLSSSLSFSNAPKAVSNFWSLGVSVARNDNNTKIAENVVENTDSSFIQIAPFFNFGKIGLKSDRARILLGVNASVPVKIYDQNETLELEAILAPNILGEANFNQYISLFGEVSYNWQAFNYYKSSSDDQGDETSARSYADQVSATIGLRAEKDHWIACEFAFGDKVFTDTKSIFNGQGIFVSFGGFLYF